MTLSRAWNPPRRVCFPLPLPPGGPRTPMCSDVFLKPRRARGGPELRLLFVHGTRSDRIVPLYFRAQSPLTLFTTHLSLAKSQSITQLHPRYVPARWCCVAARVVSLTCFFCCSTSQHQATWSTSDPTEPSRPLSRAMPTPQLATNQPASTVSRFSLIDRCARTKILHLYSCHPCSASSIPHQLGGEASSSRHGAVCRIRRGLLLRLLWCRCHHVLQPYEPGRTGRLRQSAEYRLGLRLR